MSDSDSPHEPSKRASTSGWRSTKRRQALLVLAALTSIGAIGIATPTISSATQAQAPLVTSQLDTANDSATNPKGGDESSEDINDENEPLEDEDDKSDDGGWVDPFEGMTDEEIDALTDEEFYDILDNADWDNSNFDDTDFDDWSGDDTDWDDSNWTDPFEGMTDQEIDALTDEEFYDILDNADWDNTDFDDTDFDDWSGDDTDWDDSNWTDPFEGMTDEEIDALTDEEFYDILDNADWDDTDWDDTDFDDWSGDDADWDDSNWTDPFEGMTDEEIDALTDEEFYDILDNADWDDTDWDDTDFDDWSGDDADWGDDWDEDEWDDYDDGDWDGEWGDETPVATFEVVDGNLVGSGASAEQLAQAEAIWERFSQLIPASERTMLNGFELMGPDYGGAHVYADEQDPTKWIMGVDTALSGSDLDYVLVHEFGHLLTLKASEVPPSFDNDACPTFHPGEGCALSQSTLAKFVAAFWPQTLQDQLAEINNSGDWSALDAYYAENADSFVSDYALTNPVEDLAETFTEFVLKDRPVGNTVADQKVNLLWEDQDMVALRTEIRSRMQ